MYDNQDYNKNPHFLYHYKYSAIGTIILLISKISSEIAIGLFYNMEINTVTIQHKIIDNRQKTNSSIVFKTSIHYKGFYQLKFSYQMSAARYLQSLS